MPHPKLGRIGLVPRRACLGVAAMLGMGVPLRAPAQLGAKAAHVALVFNGVPMTEMMGAHPSSPLARGFLDGLRELGHIEGRDVVVKRRSAEGHLARLPALMRELIELPVDVIVTAGPAAKAAADATRTVPIVASIDDPVGLGLTSALARPSRNVTGVVDADLTIHGKRLQLLKEIAPGSTRVAVIDFKYIDSRATPGTHMRRQELEAAARRIGVTLVTVGADNAKELDQAFAAITKERGDALIETGSPITLAGKRSIIDFAARERLPAIYTSREFAESGGLISYGPNVPTVYGHLARYVDKILKGAKIADLPFEHPTQYELVVNLRTAKSLGLTVPQPLILRASELIR